MFQNAKDKLGMDKKDGVEEVSEKIKSFMWYVCFTHSKSHMSMKCFVSVNIASMTLESVRKILFRVCLCVCVCVSDENLSLSDAMARGFTKDDLSEYSAKNGKSGNGRFVCPVPVPACLFLCLCVFVYI